MKRFLLFPLASLVAVAAFAGPASAQVQPKSSTQTVNVSGHRSYYSNPFKATNGAVKVDINLENYVPTPFGQKSCDFWLYDICGWYSVHVQELQGTRWVDVRHSGSFKAQGTPDVVTFDGGVGTTKQYRVRVSNDGYLPAKGPMTITTNVDPDGNGQ